MGAQRDCVMCPFPYASPFLPFVLLSPEWVPMGMEVAQSLGGEEAESRSDLPQRVT